MTLSLTFINPITNQENIIDIYYPNLDYYKFKHILDYNTDDDLVNILNNILKDLDCTVEYFCGRVRMTTYPIYSKSLSEYYFYISKINNQFIYNEYIDKLIKRHIDNLIFEHENPYVPITNKKKAVTKKTKLPPNKFIRRVTKDLFTGEDVYSYYNPRTKEEIESSNSNMLEELNSIKKERKKSIRVKNRSVSISSMTFSFNNKNK